MATQDRAEDYHAVLAGLAEFPAADLRNMAQEASDAFKYIVSMLDKTFATHSPSIEAATKLLESMAVMHAVLNTFQATVLHHAKQKEAQAESKGTTDGN